MHTATTLHVRPGFQARPQPYRAKPSRSHVAQATRFHRWLLQLRDERSVRQRDNLARANNAFARGVHRGLAELRAKVEGHRLTFRDGSTYHADSEILAIIERGPEMAHIRP